MFLPVWLFTLKKGLFPRHLFSTNGNYVLKTFITSSPKKSINYLKTFNKTFSGFYFFSLTVFVIFSVQILSFDKKLLLGIEYHFNKTDLKHFLKINLQQRCWESGFITSPTDNSNNGSSWRYRSLPQEPADVKMVDGALWWWVSISREEWCWGSTWEGRYPLKDVWPWLDPCTAGESAPAKTKPAVERKG